MEFTLRHVDPYSTEVSCRYRMPNGEMKIVAQRVHNYSSPVHTACSVNAYADLVSTVQNSLKRMAEEDIHNFVRQNAQVGGLQMSPHLYSNPYMNSTAGVYDQALDDPGTGGIGWQPEPMEGTNTGYGNMMSQYQRYWRHADWDAPSISRRVRITYNDGKRKLFIDKDMSENIEITPADIEQAKINWWKDARINIITRVAETKAEKLLQMFISEVDFRNYKEKGFFTVKSGNRIFRIHKDTHKFIDMYEKDGAVFVPRNKLCVHTPTRDLPMADEALAKLLLIRDNSVIEHSNLHGIDGLRPVREMEELLV